MNLKQKISELQVISVRGRYYVLRDEVLNLIEATEAQRAKLETQDVRPERLHTTKKASDAT